MLKRYNNKKNISGTLIRNAREEKGMSKVRLSQLLDTYGIYINTDELLRIEKNQLLVYGRITTNRKESIACKRL